MALVSLLEEDIFFCKSLTSSHYIWKFIFDLKTQKFQRFELLNSNLIEYILFGGVYSILRSFKGEIHQFSKDFYDPVFVFFAKRPG